MGGAQRFRRLRRGLTLGAGAAGLDIDRLVALLPQAEPTGTRRVGAADVVAIERATEAFSAQDFASGAGPIVDVAVGQLRSTLPLLGVGHQAIDAVTVPHSPRAYDRLRILNAALEPLHTSAGVAELRERLTTMAA
ncbi:MAG: hypothetical protein ACRDRS_04655 [Pseudonocardiaceae bacterium]